MTYSQLKALGHFGLLRLLDEQLKDSKVISLSIEGSDLKAPVLLLLGDFEIRARFPDPQPQPQVYIGDPPGTCESLGSSTQSVPGSFPIRNP